MQNCTCSITLFFLWYVKQVISTEFDIRVLMWIFNVCATREALTVSHCFPGIIEGCFFHNNKSLMYTVCFVWWAYWSSLGIPGHVESHTSTVLERYKGLTSISHFMSCLKNCKNCIYQCETCLNEQKNECGEQNKKNIFFCRSCKMRKSCHPVDHKFKRLGVEKDLKSKQVRCGCHCNV